MISKKKYISSWIFSPCIQQRKFYQVDELYSKFKHDTRDQITISKPAFKKILTNLSTENKKLQIVHVKKREFKYIIQPDYKDLTDLTTVRISTRKKKALITPRKGDSSPINSTILSTEETRSLSDQNQITSSNNEMTTLSVSKKLQTMEKKDSPMALSFFLSKDRAKEIIKKKEVTVSGIERLNLSYKKELDSHILDQVDVLKRAYFSFDGWRDLLCDQTDPSTLTRYQIYILRLKCLYLSKLYEFSFHFYNSVSNFKDIAKLVVDHVNKDYKHVEGISTLIGDPQTVLSWFRIFRKANNTFSYTRPGKSSDLPPFLDQNPDVVESVNSYCKNNLADLNCANLCQHLHDVSFPT